MPGSVWEIVNSFPFGVGPKCYLKPSYEVICNSSTNPPIPYLNVLNVEIMEINSSRTIVNYPNLGLTCYNSSAKHPGITKTDYHSLIIDLSETQYSLSDENWITTIGCDDMVVGIIGHANQSFIGTNCATICMDIGIALYYGGNCESTDNTLYDVGDGCCRAAIPKGTISLEANLFDFSGQWPRTNFSCSYAFVQYFYDTPLSNDDALFPILDNSTAISSLDDVLPLTMYKGVLKLALDWRIGVENCSEAQRNPATHACKSNSDCVDFDAVVGGYLCSCFNGYHGNPYLPDGCQDINECDENPCDPNSICINTPGSYNCLCRRGYTGDGRPPEKGCTRTLPLPTMIVVLIGLASALGLLLLLLVWSWLNKVLQKRKNRKRKENLFKHLLFQQRTNEETFAKTKLFTAKELEKATDYFNVSRICGRGGQGIVYKGMLSDGTIVAIKKLKHVDENQVEQFINEVVILSQINHKNVVKLMGCCLATEVPLLVYEFLPNGTLSDLIRDPNLDFPLTWNMRLNIAADIAGAVAYLHFSSTPPIYHRDIKSTNILLDEKNIVKVSDFGTSKFVQADQTHLTTLVKGTFGYLDPEYFETNQYTEKSDVYSFGVVLVELLTGQHPIYLEGSEMHRNLAALFLASIEANNLDAILDTHVREEGAKEEVIVVARLAKRCLHGKGIIRPTMKEVATELECLRISQTPSTVNDELEETRAYETKPVMMISDIEYSWTISDHCVASPSSDAHPLVFPKV